MQLIKIVPHGALATHGPMTIAAQTAAEAIEGWSRQAGLAGRPLIEVLGFDTEDKLHAGTDATELHVVPMMFGGGGGFGKILIGAAMIGISFIPGIGQAMQAALIISGSMSIVSGVVSFFMKAPSLSKEEDPEASKYIGSGKNTTAIGTLMGLGGGRMMVAGHYLSLSIDSTDLVYGKFPVSPT